MCITEAQFPHLTGAWPDMHLPVPPGKARTENSSVCFDTLILTFGEMWQPLETGSVLSQLHRVRLSHTILHPTATLRDADSL